MVIINYSYGWLNNFSWLKDLAADIGRFDETLLGIVDLTRPAIAEGGLYWPAMLLVIGSAVSQYYQSKQLMPRDKEARSLRRILKEAGTGKQADQTEVNAAISHNMRFFIPGMIFVFTVGIPSALSLYWFTSGVVAYLQQAKVLKQDEDELEALADTSTKKEIIEGEVVPRKIQPKTKKTKKASAKKRRKR